MSVKVKIYFEPRDLWIGVYWDRKGSILTHVYVCLVPCLPIRFTWRHERKAGA